ncbi:MAG: hypothetical protein FJX76_03680 [Armatimonadetes bacterium]|nr:hypothetical protein [Armatimonadota bacterium]
MADDSVIQKVEPAGKQSNKVVFDNLKQIAKSEDKAAKEGGNSEGDGFSPSEGLRNGDEG